MILPFPYRQRRWAFLCGSAARSGSGSPFRSHQSLLLHCFLVSPFAHHKRRMGDNISRFFIVKSGCALCHGVLHGQQGSILLILHLHKPGCPGCRDIVLRYHGCNIVSIDPHPGIEKFPVRNILMGRLTDHGWPAVGNWMSGTSKHVTIFTTPAPSVLLPNQSSLPRRWRWCCVLPLPPEDPVAPKSAVYLAVPVTLSNASTRVMFLPIPWWHLYPYPECANACIPGVCIICCSF